MVCREVARVADADRAKQSAIRAKDIVASGFVKLRVTLLFPGAKIKIRASLAKVGKHVKEAISCQGI